jgi:hypothetical protein
MKTELLSLALMAALGSTQGRSPSAQACGLSELSLDALARQATSQDSALASAAITQLRSKGPAGLNALLGANAAAVEEHGFNSGPIDPSKHDSWERLKTALDEVSGQCDAYAAGLYWYTDFDEAKRAAKASGKPIVSLRLLGKLNEEYSCANSRFFRTTLYPNAEVSRYLREHFILHWQSVRPVPRITIDFGDGRKIERTITGNSVHYILDTGGELIDALPGLYGPKAFLQQLKNAEPVALSCAGLTEDRKQELLRQYHLQCRQAIAQSWNTDLARLSEPPRALPVATLDSGREEPPIAERAGRLALSKRAIEAPLLKATQPHQQDPLPGKASVGDELWGRIAALHAVEARLDSASFKLLSNKLPNAFQASQLTTSKQLIEGPPLRTLKNLQRSIAEDTVRNEYSLHAQIHEWFIENHVSADVSAFNAKVYAELFLMPESDPWLGLAPADVYTGLPNDGLVQGSSTPWPTASLTATK